MCARASARLGVQSRSERDRCSTSQHHRIRNRSTRRNNIANQTLAPGAVLARNHRSLRNIPMPNQRSLDFPGSIRKPRTFTCASARPRNSSTPSSFACKEMSELDRLLQRNQRGGFTSGTQLHDYLKAHKCIGLTESRARVYSTEGQYVCIYDLKDNKTGIYPCAWTRTERLSNKGVERGLFPFGFGGQPGPRSTEDIADD